MENVMYIGRSLSKDGVMSKELFTTYPTALVESLKEKYPLIDLLFVRVEELPEALKEVSTPGTARAVAYEQVRRHV